MQEMHIRSHTFVLIIFLVFSLKCGKVSGSDTAMKTWKQAVLDCYGNNSFLESNTTVLQKYMLNHNKVNDSIWVGSFEALLPWIEIRGCYNIPLTCNSLERDEKHAENLQLCQIECMKRRYFAFNKKNERCVCFDEHGVVNKKTDKASLCQDCIDYGDCNTYATVYKVFDKSITSVGNNHDCLSYKCDSKGVTPTFSTKECYTFSRSYCRDGRRADDPVSQHFLQYLDFCEKNHSTYPLLHSENPVKLCNVSDSLTPEIDVWVGVYRQKLFIDNSNKTVIQYFDQIEQLISRCDYFPANGGFKQAENCSGKHHYKCAPDTQIDIQEEPIKTTSTPVCQSENPYTGNADDQSSGIIAGTVTSILVIGVIVVIVVVTCRRFNSKSRKHKDNLNEEDPPRNNICTQENNSEGHHNAIDMTLSSNTFTKPPADNNARMYVQKAAGDEHEYAIANPGYNDFQVKVDTKTNQNGDYQGPHSLAIDIQSDDYCLAKPITDPCDMNYHTYNADYDHLSSVEHKENDSVNVYDHVPNIIDSDDTYDHSAENICKSDANNYDHFDVQN